MRSNCAAVLFLLAVMCAAAIADETPAAKPTIDWVKDLETAATMSEKDGRPVIAYFTFNACVWCKRLEKACFDDPGVVELSEEFIWVKVNRDDTPDIPKRLNVSAYPSLLTLGKDQENIFRFKSYQEPPEFTGNLQTALQRYALYKQGKDWMLPPERPARVVDEGEVKPLKAPSDDVPGGLTSLGDFIWVAQGELFQIEVKTGRVAAKYQLPASVGDLCTDGKQLFAVTYGWTAGKPIYVIDPTNGKVVREIITESNKKNRSHGAKGIAWHDGHLHVLSGMVGRVFEIDVDSGEVLGEMQLDGNWLSGLDVHRGNWITGGRTHLWQFDSKTGKVLRQVTANYPLRNVGTHNSDVLMMEQPIFGFGRRHERIQVWPRETLIYRWNDDK
jgi:hypothetical protein